MGSGGIRRNLRAEIVAGLESGESFRIEATIGDLLADHYEPGDHERVENRGNEGRCAGCMAYVSFREPSVIRYHPSSRGGIFHQRCEPQGAGWYSVDGDEYGC